jgi:segregation and condensation protein A
MESRDAETGLRAAMESRDTEPGLRGRAARDAYLVKLSDFEGPLDLLLHLIKKHEVDLYKLSVSSITDQYLSTIREAEELNLDIAGEFLVMAATLIYLKSRALLPPEEREEFEDEEPIDPESQLIEQLLEHERFQRAAAVLATRPVLGRDVFGRTVVERAPGDFVEALPPVGVSELLAALERVLARQVRLRAHQVNRERLTIRDGVGLVIEHLRLSPRTTFEALFPDDASRVRIIVTFLAILELIKHGALRAVQGETHGSIELELLREVDVDELLSLDLEAPIA